ncbi:TetR/AcrR family transcriptional regulator [Paraburkholderia sp. LEh10]|uniref:TetR/AcrR family transcriptional regulator n=1 Tax=Paraburkholderia sp. LEh10 TaxID=2821353 RepID=UPI001AE584C9|nr:TetR/AcrR family transcriptional regulator [Paraburkholderia sp. LEh10]MBP0594183.1 TetR/AcrR family transcriptional regulator [Paraburkholderia sp. LEh10]
MESALICFSTHDFETVTIHQISNFTVVSPSMLFAEYGNKTQLFAAALSWYIDNRFDLMLRQLRKAYCPIAVNLCFFRVISERSFVFGGSSARLVFITAISLAIRNSAFEHISSSAMQKLETFFCECVTEGQGTINNMTREPAEHVAKLLIGSVAALPVPSGVDGRHVPVDRFVKSVELLLRTSRC